MNRLASLARALAFLAVSALCAQAVQAGEAPPAASNPQLERRVMDVAEQLRCLVCQNQTIADSQAGLAVDLRNQIREQLSKGATESDIVEYMVARYGDFVLYKPPFKATTALLWIGPALLLLGGLAWLFIVLRRRHASLEDPKLSDAEREKARALLEGTPE